MIVFNRTRPGAMLLITVMIMGAVALIIGISLALRGIGEMEMSYSSSQAQKVLAVADGCAEESLIRLWQDSAYTGEKMNLGNGKCSIDVVRNGTGAIVTIDASVDAWSRTVQIDVDTESIEMQLRQWRQMH